MSFALPPQALTHPPATHESPGGQTIPHTPQFVDDVCRFVQVSGAQTTSPVPPAHVVVHAPF